MSLSPIKKNLKSLLVKDMSKAMKKFESILTSDASLYNDLILQQGAYNGLKNDKNRGLLTDARATQRENQIRYALMEMIDMIEADDVDMTAVQAALQDQNNGAVAAPPVNDNPADSPHDISQQGIYISYAWGGESEKIVDLLDTELDKRGVKIIRDKRALPYKGSIVEFMKDIGKGNKIIAVISEKYLKSENCMFELVQIYEHKEFAKRIFPIILEDANIYKPVSRINYIKYWDGEIAKLDEAIKSLERGMDVLALNQELNNYGKIRKLFSDMAFILKDMNALSPEMHRNQNFDTLYKGLTGK